MDREITLISIIVLTIMLFALTPKTPLSTQGDVWGALWDILKSIPLIGWIFQSMETSISTFSTVTDFLVGLGIILVFGIIGMDALGFLIAFVLYILSTFMPDSLGYVGNWLAQQVQLLGIPVLGACTWNALFFSIVCLLLFPRGPKVVIINKKYYERR